MLSNRAVVAVDTDEHTLESDRLCWQLGDAGTETIDVLCEGETKKELCEIVAIRQRC